MIARMKIANVTLSMQGNTIIGQVRTGGEGAPMTQPSQREHCDHYPVCYLIGMQTGCIADECHEVCEHDTRNRPHAPASDDIAFKDSIIEQQKIHIGNLNAKMAEMMHEAARAATLAVLKLLEPATRSFCPYNYGHAGYCQNKTMRCDDCVKQWVLESLRITGDGGK